MANDWRELVDEVLDLQKDLGMDTSPAPGLQWDGLHSIGAVEASRPCPVRLQRLRSTGVHSGNSPGEYRQIEEIDLDRVVLVRSTMHQ